MARSNNLQGALHIGGTGSDVGKSILVTGLCRAFVRKGFKVAPFKGQNMALNAEVTKEGGEIGRAQGLQAVACQISPSVDMNPVLLKPTGQSLSQLIVRGKAVGEIGAKDYQVKKQELSDTVDESFSNLWKNFDLIIAEGAGSFAEINLKGVDLANLGLAQRLGINCILAADIDRGGVFASIYGTQALVDQDARKILKGYVINKFRGDISLVKDGLSDFDRLVGFKNLGILPYLTRSGLDGEDSSSLSQIEIPLHSEVSKVLLDVAIIGFPTISNISDFDPLRCEKGVRIRYIKHLSQLGDPDLIILPGSKVSVDDLNWLKSQNGDELIKKAHSNGSFILGICGGFQMLGKSIKDGIESSVEITPGLNLIEAETAFRKDKVVKRVSGRAKSPLGDFLPFTGYQIHNGAVSGENGFIKIDGEVTLEGCVSLEGRIWATSCHGLFENDKWRSDFLNAVSLERIGCETSELFSYVSLREEWIDYLADWVERYLDLDEILEIATSSPIARL